MKHNNEGARVLKPGETLTQEELDDPERTTMQIPIAAPVANHHCELGARKDGWVDFGGQA